MSEGPSFFVSEDLPNPCEEESGWIYSTFSMTKNSKRNRPSEDEEECGLTKSSKVLAIPEKEGSFVLNMAQKDNQDQDGNHVDASSLINPLGRDLSINCLLHCSRSDYGSIASLNRSFRSLIRSGYLYKLRRQLGIKEHWVYFSCDLLKWEAFDPMRRRWMTLPSMTSNECFCFSDKESLAVGTELLVFGKDIESQVIYKYNILTNSWTSGMKTNTPRCLFGSASLGEIAIVAGGCDSRGNILSSAELYNSEIGTWCILPNMHKPRKLCSGVFMDGKFYVIGGIGIGNPSANGGERRLGIGNSKVLTSGEVYDMKTRTWVEIPDMFPIRNGEAGDASVAMGKAPPLIAVVKNELYAAYYDENEVLKYEKKSNVWITIGKLPEQTTSMNGWGMAFRACGNQLIVISGPKALNGGFININAWKPDEGSLQWTFLGRKHSGNFVYNCAVMGC
ncbi:hypothetical protein ACH5RR_007678 [Cinchona calisaya]|uniref:Uncharacterized protein n=1 Tax=Cinchona calisaya TaxID=153742 RepID=A0ABD3ABS2_9GENT